MGSSDAETAVVTGGSTGIGRAAARRLAVEEVHVLATARRADDRDKPVAEVGDSAAAVAGDLRGDA